VQPVVGTAPRDLRLPGVVEKGRQPDAERMARVGSSLRSSGRIPRKRLRSRATPACSSTVIE
jgi:hypothetical protein